VHFAPSTAREEFSAPLVEVPAAPCCSRFPLISLAAAALIYLLVNNHYEVAFVYQVTSKSMPTYLKITAWWGGQAGSLVFWGWLLSAFTSAVALRKWERDREFLPWVIVVSSITLAFFLGLVVFYENPFARYWQDSMGQILTDIDGKPIVSLLAPMQGTTNFLPSDGQGLESAPAPTPAWSSIHRCCTSALSPL